MKHSIDWRGILARLPLPMLALAASYGVYRFALLFVPEWVAIVQAAAFECTYIGLAVTRGLDAMQRRRATAISLGAVAASIIYNTLAGWFHAQPDILVGAGPIAWLCLALLHGAPLAWVAFLVANLLLHSEQAGAAQLRPALAYAEETPVEYATLAVQTDGARTQTSQTIVADKRCKYCGAEGLTSIEVARHGRARARSGACPV